MVERVVPGIFDGLTFPARLVAHVVSPARDPDERRIRGYAVESDLAAHVDFLDTVHLALTGELPTTAQHAALACALTLLAPVHVGEGPAHAGVLARVAGAPEEAVGGIVATALGQQLRDELALARGVFAWLDGAVELPAAARVTDPSAAAGARHAALAARTVTWFSRPLPDDPVLTRVAAAFALLGRLGVRDPMQLHALALVARVPVIFAEAQATRFGGVREYATHTPPFTYVEEEET